MRTVLQTRNHYFFEAPKQRFYLDHRIREQLQGSPPSIVLNLTFTAPLLVIKNYLEFQAR